MSASVSLLIHSRDAELLRRLEALARTHGEPYCTDNRAELERSCSRLRPAVLLLDLRLGEPRDFLPGFLKNYQDLTIIALGDKRSDPALIAKESGVYAVEALDADAQRLSEIIARALEHARLRAENEHLLADAARAAYEAAVARANATVRKDSPFSLRPLAQALHHLDDLGTLLNRVAEGLAATANVTRVGIFMQQGDGDYQLAADLRCSADVRSLTYRPSDPFVQWLDRHAHLVARTALKAATESGDRAMLERQLDAHGAEVIAPLHARGRLIGWLLIGHRATGLPFEYSDLEDLSTAGGHISTALENALLYEEITRQKSLAETLLHTLPTGIIATDEEGVVRWFSTAAQEMLALPSEKVIGQPVEILGSRLADMLRRAIQGELFEFPQAWTDAVTHRSIYAQTRILGGRQKCLGALAMIQDVTAQRALQEKQEQIDRAQFWNELAASMSHEIRNPLVAIKTFAQLLPERYNDEGFRDDFSKLVSQEVDRLNGIIDQINSFAHPPDPSFSPLDIRQPIKRSIEQTLAPGQRNGIRISAQLDENLPPIWGDARALSACFSHLLRNSLEALEHKKGGQIDLTVSRLANGSGDRGVAVTIRDNGHGIPTDIAEKVFSPFCTTKARGMGLGLPIAQRTVVEHNGKIEIATGQDGTAVTVTLPVPGAGGDEK